MSIVYFPTIYEDELLWSAITRYYSHVGYINEIEVAKDLYENPKSFMNREFVHAFHKEVMEKITSQKDWNTIIEKHTMYPYYAIAELMREAEQREQSRERTSLKERIEANKRIVAEREREKEKSRQHNRGMSR